ncbi:MAG TPA: hypothetical protein VFX33_13445 [Actinomycetales bacterium]|nr:hypothetical protein [Actinomycetales bacterium]
MRPTRTGRRVRAAVVTIVGLGVLAGAGVVAVQAFKGPVVVTERCTSSANGESHELDPEQASNAALIAAVAVKRGLPARAATIGIATAIQESKLRNIDYGDRDSVGLFQQRPSQGWGTVEQIMDPIYASNAFYDVLVKVKGYESMEITDASHRVQRSAFPEAVARRESQGRSFASALTGWSPASLDCRLRPVKDAQPQQAGQDGLLPRAAEVRAALDREMGDPGFERSGPAQLLINAGEDAAGQRRAWAAAQWAVASAAEYDIVSVECDGRLWRRDKPGDGWAKLPADPNRGMAYSEQPGRVAIEVANP